MKKRFADQGLDLLCQALLGIHAFTGCDTVSAFSGKGKAKPFKLMAKKKEYVKLFSRLGETPDVTEDIHENIQKFVCDMHGRCEDSSTDYVRYKLCTAKQGQAEAKSLPPCSDSLSLHTMRTAYQIYVWRSCLKNRQNLPHPVNFGWKEDDDGNLEMRWNTVLPAPEETWN